MTLIIATVQVGNYERRGAEYLRKLYAGIARNLTGVDWRGVCLTDDPETLPEGVEAIEPPPGLTGWWNKVALFKPGMFPAGSRVLYSDLDTILVGDLTDIASYAGPFAIMRDPYHPEHMGSSLMAWEAGDLAHIWDRYDENGAPQFDPRGDQRWIESMQPQADYWQDMFPGQVVSFKADCWVAGGIPDGARVVCFHGQPRPHQCQASYIKELWTQT